MTTIHLDLDDTLLWRADTVLSQQGLSIPEAVGQWLTLVATGDALPMESGQPNQTTIDAMEECDEDLPSFGCVDTLMAYLHEGH
uniref:Antitoxin component of the RelBE or YafQ-DinJ toxin-antitoxin module n=1 Tax=Candidatus Kentrum sp. FM TaxID=2126340 RepID=A0A450U1E3_9GAMM|nr:MAG: Antitoxin component of the RelBE or YafQ-DinJ toxin-antitoxin module [Candidatus Kentron sp. FM]VFJ76439.1 MAG: Antitoxin component of the RelBE or YafQ-DinJ toxin-antitoxin module [Candidatus Kentron sp. FM]VFK23091.1 MAG: Antitoxin component of the RelBE or YafQ-DinJ toxin-antitoxin module [Candidatus Kentron sp. FM]